MNISKIKENKVNHKYCPKFVVITLEKLVEIKDNIAIIAQSINPQRRT
jgi:hypothetical protein